jgi:hypothetical protein
MAKLNFNVTAQVVDGPKFTVGAQNWEVEAYDRVDSDIPPPVPPATSLDTTVQVAPGVTAGAVSLLVVYADKYTPPLTYKAKAAATPAPLDKPLVLWGANAVKLLEEKLETITFTNSDTTKNTVHILVARDATP